MLKHIKTRAISAMLLVAFLLQSCMVSVSAKDNAAMDQWETDAVMDTSVVDAAADIADTHGEEPTAVKEDETKRDEYTKHYLMSDGGFVAVTYNEPVHYEENNEWKEIDNTLSEQSFSITTNEHDHSAVSFSKDASAEELVRLTNDGHEVSWSVYGVETTVPEAVQESERMTEFDSSVSGISASVGTATDKTDWRELSVRQQLVEGTLNKQVLQSKSKATIETDTNEKESVKGLTKQELKQLPVKATSSLVYENALKDVDLRYTVSPQRIKEDIVIKAPGTAESYGMDLNTELNAVLKEDNSIDLNDQNGKMRFHIPAPYMYDNSGAVSEDIKVELAKTETGYTLVLMPNMEWLASSDRVYPVVLDPTIQDVDIDHTNSMVATYVYEEDDEDKDDETKAKNENTLFVGKSDNKIYRSYVQYQAMPYISGVVTDAEFSLSSSGGTLENASFYLYPVKKKWSKTMTWEKQPEMEEDQEGTLWSSDGTAATYINFSVRQEVKKWYDNSVWGKNKNYGFVLCASDENKDYLHSFHSFSTQSATLAITYYLETQEILEGTYYIKAAYTNTYITQNSNKVLQNSLKQENNQRWRLECRGDGFYNIFLKSDSSMRLYTKREGTNEVVRVGNEFGFDHLNAKWMISAEGGGTYSIVSAYSLTRTTVNALGVENGSSKEGANILSSAFTGANNQKWELISADRPSPPSFAVTPLSLNDESDSDTISQGQERWYSFTAKASGYYTFISSGSGNMSGELYSYQAMNGMQLLRTDSSSGENDNFLIKHYLPINSKYYLRVKGSGTYTIGVYPYSVQVKHYFDEAYIASSTNAVSQIQEYRDWVNTMFKKGFNTAEQTGLKLVIYDESVEKLRTPADDNPDRQFESNSEKRGTLISEFKEQLTSMGQDPDIGVLFTGHITKNGRYSGRRCLIGLGGETDRYSADVRHRETYLHELGHALGASPNDSCMADSCIMTYKKAIVEGKEASPLLRRLPLVKENIDDPDLNKLFCEDCLQQIRDNLELTNKIARSHGVGTSYDADETTFNGDIATAADLLKINNYLDKDFQLVNDIDLTGVEFLPIASSGIFTGTLNGNGYKIKNMTMDYPSIDNVGLFANSNGTIKNLTLENVTVSGRKNTGALVGNAETDATITNCHITGNSSVTGGEFTGGLVGFNKAAISNSSTSCSVRATGNFAGGLVGDNYNTITGSHTTGLLNASNYAGGLVGNNRSEGYITNCYATGEVNGLNRTGGLVGNNDAYIDTSYATGDVVGGFNVGGFVGRHEKGKITSSYSTGAVDIMYDYGGGFVGYVKQGEIGQCYSLSSVNGAQTKIMGGFVGYGESADVCIVNCFACATVQPSTNAAGFAGFMNGSIQNGYAVSDNETGFVNGGDATVTGCYFSNVYGGEDAKAAAKTPAEMLTLTTYAGWDFSSIWQMDGEAEYPTLQGLDKPHSFQNIGNTFTADGLTYTITSPMTVQVGTDVSPISVSGTVVIPSVVSNGTESYTVTSVGINAFRGRSLTSVTIPATVVRIETSAFQSCKSLTNVIFAAESRLQSIADHAFNGCSGLTDITIPATITSIGNNAFQTCTGLTDITFAAGSALQSIGNHAFNGCTSLTGITIPDAVTIIGSNAFQGCAALTSVTFGSESQLNTLSSYAFYDCRNLERINLPLNLRSVGGYAFTFCEKLTSIFIPYGVESLPAKVFYGCSSLKSASIPISVKSIEADTFIGCSVVKLYVVSGSYAHTYAVNNHIDFEAG